MIKLFKKELEFPTYNVGFRGKYVNGNVNVIPVNNVSCHIMPCENSTKYENKELFFRLIAVKNIDDGTFEALNSPDGFDLTYVDIQNGKMVRSLKKLDWWLNSLIEREALQIINKFFEKQSWTFELAHFISLHNTILSAQSFCNKTQQDLLNAEKFLKSVSEHFDSNKLKILIKKQKKQNVGLMLS